MIILAAVLGIVGRTILPYLQTLQAHPDTKFDRAFLVPPIVSVIIALIAAPLALSAIAPESWEIVTFQGMLGIFVAAWGATDLSRSGQKLIQALSAPKE